MGLTGIRGYSVCGLLFVVCGLLFFCSRLFIICLPRLGWFVVYGLLFVVLLFQARNLFQAFLLACNCILYSL